MRGFCLEVNGDFACFTRPEMKVERVSYDVITPSAARAIFDSILWKPAIYWQMTKIEVLSPLKWISVRRNEVDKTASPRSNGILIEDDRQQRAGLFLRDVKYRLHARFVFIPPEQRSAVINPVPEWLMNSDEVAHLNKTDIRPDETEAKYAAMFERRAGKGQCFNQPYLGCREFSCRFHLVNPDKEPAAIPEEFAGKRDLGWMLYDLDYSSPDNIRSLFFRAQMENGIIIIPPRDSEEVKG